MMMFWMVEFFCDDGRKDSDDVGIVLDLMSIFVLVQRKSVDHIG